MTDLELSIANFLMANSGSSGRVIAKAIGVDKSQVNSCLYNNDKKEKLFMKKGLTPPLWSCRKSLSEEKHAAQVADALEELSESRPDITGDIEDGSKFAIPTNLNRQRMTNLGRTDYYGFTDDDDDEDLTDL